MRTFLASLTAMMAIGFVFAAPANAARASWSCTGPAYVCGSSSSSYSQAGAKKAKHAKHGKKTYKKAASYGYQSKKVSKKTYKKVASYGYQPKKASKKAHKKVAAAASYTSGSYSGGSSGIASYYWQGSKTASGQAFNPSGMTAAHRTLPFGTKVLVTNNSNGKSVVVTINDRGPFIKGRIIDLSAGAAGVIGMKSAGLARVSMTVLGK